MALFHGAPCTVIEKNSYLLILVCYEVSSLIYLDAFDCHHFPRLFFLVRDLLHKNSG